MAPDICMESDNETFLTTHQKKKEDKIPCKYTAVLFFAAAQLAHQRTVPQTTTQPGIDRSLVVTVGRECLPLSYQLIGKYTVALYITIRVCDGTTVK